MIQRDVDAILLAGPTASGKSAFGLALAEALNGAIVNADSMQVYDGLHVVTARPSAADMARAPHHLYGHVRPDYLYSVGDWLSDVAGLLPQLKARGQVPIILGGTGLYFSALLNGLSPIPEIDPAIREMWRSFRMENGQDALYLALEQRDPKMAARLMPQDSQRVTRALEVLEQTGRSLADWQAVERSTPLLSADRVLRLVLNPSRDSLYDRINRRFEQMISEGALEEVAALLDLRLDPALPVMKAIGVPQLTEVLHGRASYGEAISLAQRDSRRYAKRQGTWFRNQCSDWHLLDPRNFCKVIEEIRTCLEKRLDPLSEAD